MPPDEPWPADGCCGQGDGARAPWMLARRGAGRRGFLACASAGPLAAALPGRARAQAYSPLLEDLVVQQVPGAPVYYVLGHPGVPSTANQGHTSNAGFVVTDEGVVVFDAVSYTHLTLPTILRV